MKPWMRELLCWMPGYGVFLGVAVLCAGIAYGGFEATKPDRSAPVWRQRIRQLEDENLQLRILLDEQRREAIRPSAASEANIPAQSLPTK